jgi:hypothetical protein
MNKQRNEKRLDELISRTINTEKLQFDAEKWKQKYPDEFQSLLSRAAKGASARQPNILKIILKSPLTKIAAAAVIIVVISFFIAPQGPSEQADTTVSKVTKSPAEMLTATSLIIAFRHGGIEAIEKQCDKALEMQKPPLDKLDIKELFTEIEIDLERTEL